MTPASVFEDRRQVFIWVHLVSAVALSFFIFTHWLEGCCYEISMLEAVLVMIMLVESWRIRRGASLASIENVLMASALALFSSLIFFESIENTGAFWVAGFPFVAYFVHQVKKARFWVVLLLLEIVVAAFLELGGWVHAPYSATQLFCLVGIVLFFGVLAHIYQSQLELRNSMLQDSYDALEQQKKCMQAILDYSPIGIWMLDEQRRFQFLNRAWVEWSGISEQQAQQASNYSDLLPKALAERALATDKACMESEGAYYFREEILCADGQLRTLDMVKVRLNGAGGEPSGLVGFAIDVSEKVQAEQEQRSLEHQVQHSQRLESLGIMAGGIAHDFNNLLTAIQGGIELARLEGGLSDSLYDSLDCMDVASQAAIELCQQMLTYSGKGLMQSEALSLGELIEDMRSLLDVSIGKHAALCCDIEGSGSVIEADRSQIRQVVLNLVINASEAIATKSHGEIKVSLQVQQLEQPDKYQFYGPQLKPGVFHVLTVEDNGCGMDADTVEHMFDPFFTTKFTGRGLGLSAIQGILHAHHAGLSVDSRPGQGTRISVWFPDTETVLVGSGDQSQPAGGEQLSGRVMLVDDEPGVLQVASRMLEKLGYDIVTADNGRAAVDSFSRDHAFDWILLDVTMPEMDGVECLKQLRAIQPELYVVMTSGYSADSTLIPSQGCQPDDFLTKPFTFASLRAVAERASRS